MKKILLSLAAVALSVFAMSADEITLTSTTDAPTWTASGEDFTATKDGFTMVLAKAGSGNALVIPTEAHIRVYQDATLTITAPSGVKMTKVAMTEVYSKATDISQAKFSEGWTAYGTLTSSTKAEEFGATSDGLNSITLTAGKQLRVSQIVITYTVPSVVKDEAGMSFPQAEYTVMLGDAFDAPDLTKTTDAAAAYTSSNEEVAMVDAATGVVTIKGIGTTTIKATCEETAKFYGGTASYTLTVKDPSVLADMLGEADAAGFEEWTVEDGTLPEGLDYVWSWKSYGGKYYLNGSGYNKTAFEVSSLAVSPVIDLTGKKAVTMSFDHAAKFQTTLKELCGVQVREENATDWTPLTIAQWPTAGSWDFANSGDIDLSAYDGKKIQIAFKYGSTTEGADTWEVKNLVIKGKSSGVAEIEVVDEDAPVIYYNMQGVRVANPENGLYIRVQGNKATKVLVK